ncbi:hypothetical protein BC828DRAFT_390920 [Blastocladiella britannica]|nr:hypothetical protein BC828DRAFT_390920 [Blastocladiella britannica]
MIDHVSCVVLAHAAGASRTPEDALAVLNVLPASRSSPLELAAALSRGFKELRPALAIKHGHALTLLPRYPRHILFSSLNATLSAAASRGDLPTLRLLWKLAGPDTCGRPLWIQIRDHRVVDLVIGSGKLDALDWLDQVTTAANLDLYWDKADWEKPAAKGYYHVLQWGLERGRLPALTVSIVLASTAERGEIFLLDAWFATRLDKPGTVNAINYSRKSHLFFKDAPISSLEWWWTHIARGTELPDPGPFCAIIDDCFCKEDTELLEWWWPRFLEHRTPKHLFGSWELVDGRGWNFSVATAEWLWQHSHFSGTHWSRSTRAFDFDADWHNIGLPFLQEFDFPTMDLMRWWTNKSVYLGQNIVVQSAAAWACMRAGRVDSLDCILHFYDVLDVECTRDEIKALIKLARGRPKLDAQPRFDEDEDEWTPHMLDSATEHDLDLKIVNGRELTNMGKVHSACARQGISVESLLPLTPIQWGLIILHAKTSVIPEWWLQLHLAGGHAIKFPVTESIGTSFISHFSTPYWLKDVHERKLPVLVRSYDNYELFVPFVFSESLACYFEPLYDYY